MYRHVSLFLSLSPDMENKMSSIDTKVFNGEKEKTLTHLNVTTEIVYDDDEIRPEDTSNLRRVAQSLPLAAGFILINEFWYVECISFVRIIARSFVSSVLVKGIKFILGVPL